jgi:quinol monooxygenase YgiN
MWAQLIKMQMAPGRDGELPGMFGRLREIEQAGSGLLQTLVMQDQKDPSQAYVLVVFESEEHARAREQDPARQEAMKATQAMMGEVFAGPPEFVDMTVVANVTP